MLYNFATLSAVEPMCPPLNSSYKASCNKASYIGAAPSSGILPIRYPIRAFGSKKGTCVMFSVPTTNPISVFPNWMSLQAISNARIPDAQFWLTTTAFDSTLIPIRIET